MLSARLLPKERRVEIVGESGYMLSRKELIYLAALTGAKRLLGVRDDTTLLSRDEILSHWPDIKSSLTEKRYLEENPDNSVSIHKELFQCINVCVNPDIYFTCTKYADFFNCYINKNFCTRLEQSKNMRDTFILAPVFLHKNIKKYIFDFLVPEGEYADVNEKISFNKNVYENIKNVQPDDSSPNDVDLNDPAYNILTDKKASRSLLKCRMGSNGVNKVNIYTIYVSGGVIWNLREGRDGKHSYLLKSISSENLIADLGELADSFKYLFLNHRSES